MKYIKECPFCGRQFTQLELDDLFIDDTGLEQCSECGTMELMDSEEVDNEK